MVVVGNFEIGAGDAAAGSSCGLTMSFGYVVVAAAVAEKSLGGILDEKSC